MIPEVIDTRSCALGEGPFWHPLREQFFWFDIAGKKIFSRKDGQALDWQFDENVSAAGWIDIDTLLIASETGLHRFNLATGQSEHILAIEADSFATRSNDWRANPWGGFWIGTMGKLAEHGAGKIYRYFEGTLTVLFEEITIPNAICFSPDRTMAYFTDTPQQVIMAQPLDELGWPDGPARNFVELRPDDLFPDGAVVDSEGCLWNAQWGAGRIARYSPDGTFLSDFRFPAKQTTCPAFGGPGLQNMFVTTASEGLEGPDLCDGQIFKLGTQISGRAEPRVLLQ